MCRVPQCHRKPVVTASSVCEILWTGETEIDMCIPCYMAYKDGHRRHPSETQYEIRDDIEPEDLDRIKEHLIR